jgi:diacylglycerol O-acyltransferase / wax synthase
MRSYLSPLDAALLEIEELDEAAHMHVGCAMVFDPLPADEPPPLERLREQARARLGESSILRRRLSMPRIDGLSLPVWLPDPGYDVGQQIASARLPWPGGEQALMDWLGEHFSQRLDRARPLWETTLLEGLEGGRWALVFKVHHCLIDGVSGATIVAAMIDVESEPRDGVTSMVEFISMLGREAERGVLLHSRGAVGELSSDGIDAAVHPRNVASILTQAREMAALVARDFSPPPATSLNRQTGTGRRFAVAEVPLADFNRVERELGGTMNDIALAVLAGGLHRLFEERGEQVDRVRAMAPIGIRLDQASEALLAGSEVSSLFLDLDLTEPDPLLRYRGICAAASARDQRKAAAGQGAAFRFADLEPPFVQSVVAHLSFTPRLFNVSIANFPTSPIPFYSLGAQMRRAIPHAPIFSGNSLGVAVGGCDGRIALGLTADCDAVPDLEVLRRGIESSALELCQAATSTSAA